MKLTWSSRAWLCALFGHRWSEWIAQSYYSADTWRRRRGYYRWCARCYLEEWE